VGGREKTRRRTRQIQFAFSQQGMNEHT